MPAVNSACDSVIGVYLRRCDTTLGADLPACLDVESADCGT